MGDHHELMHHQYCINYDITSVRGITSLPKRAASVACSCTGPPKPPADIDIVRYRYTINEFIEMIT